MRRQYRRDETGSHGDRPRVLAISGSTRAASTNTALLRALAKVASSRLDIRLYGDLISLPIFSPDREGDLTPQPVLDLAAGIQAAEALLFSIPEYVHALPGGVKNAIDWMVSREEIIGKPIALVHGSHRGEEGLAQARRVLGTVSEGFREDIFLRLPVLKLSADEITALVTSDPHRAEVTAFLNALHQHIRGGR